MDEPQAPLTEARAIIEAHRRADSLLTAHELGVLEAAISTAPVQGLTDEQIDELLNAPGTAAYLVCDARRRLHRFARAIERAVLASAPHPPSNTLGDALAGPGDPVASLPTPPIATGDDQRA